MNTYDLIAFSVITVIGMFFGILVMYFINRKYNG